MRAHGDADDPELSSLAVRALRLLKLLLTVLVLSLTLLRALGGGPL